MASVSQACACPVKPCRRSSGARSSPPQSSRWKRRPWTVTFRSIGRSRFISARSELDAARAPRAATTADVGRHAIWDDDVGGLLPAKLLQLADRALDPHLGALRELFRRVAERGRVDLERDRQGAHRGEELRL